MGCYESRVELLCVLISFKGPCPVNTLFPTVAGFCIPILNTGGFCKDSLPCHCANICWLRAECTCLTLTCISHTNELKWGRGPYETATSGMYNTLFLRLFYKDILHCSLTQHERQLNDENLSFDIVKLIK